MFLRKNKEHQHSFVPPMLKDSALHDFVCVEQGCGWVFNDQSRTWKAPAEPAKPAPKTKKKS